MKKKPLKKSNTAVPKKPIQQKDKPEVFNRGGIVEAKRRPKLQPPSTSVQEY